jgi:hypothetical protein
MRYHHGTSINLLGLMRYHYVTGIPVYQLRNEIIVKWRQVALSGRHMAVKNLDDVHKNIFVLTWPPSILSGETVKSLSNHPHCAGHC